MMRTLLAKTLLRLAHWLRSKGMPSALTGSQWSGTSFVDRLQAQSPADAQRDPGGAEEHRLDLRQHQRRHLRQLSAAPVRHHATTTSRGRSA